jgi:cystathionine gamma-synthase
MSFTIQSSHQLLLQRNKQNIHDYCSLQSLTTATLAKVGIQIVRHNTNTSSSKSKGLPDSALPLGHPLPLDEHACSVSLPTWSSVVGYEEGSPQVTENLACGYPRFVYHPYIIKLMDVALEMDKAIQNEETTGSGSQSENQWDCIVLPSRDSALRCHDFLVKACGYLDGNAASPRLVDSNLSQIIGNARIPLFSTDNAINTCADADAGTGTDNNCYNPKAPIRVLDVNAAGVHAVIFPAQTAFAIEAKSYWQHTGEVLSSRRAEVALALLNPNLNNTNNENYLPRVTSSFHCKGSDNESDNDNDWTMCPHTNQPHLTLYPSNKCNRNLEIEDDPFDGIKERIASIVGTPSSHVFLAPSGMASIYAALRSARRRQINTSQSEQDSGDGAGMSTGGTSVVFGFPYLDTLKMCSRPELVPDGVEFFGHGDENDLANLEQMLKNRKKDNNPGISVLITEFPSNPLLNCPNLQKLRALADEYDFAVVVDDTIGNFANLDLINSGLADAVCTSLTKLFNGRGDAMAGSIITNPNTKMGQWLQRDLETNHHDNEGLWEGDAYAINANSVDFLTRSTRINETTEALADWLNERDEVAVLYYPKFTCPTVYNSVLNKSDFGGSHKAGYGGLLSILLHPHICQRTFYDKLDLSKGPSLGTDFSLVCPYTLLAHYHELDFAMTYDVQPNLLRCAIGLEELDVLKEKFTIAFQESKLHPKLPLKSTIENTTSRGYCNFSHAYQTKYSSNNVNQSANIGNGLLGLTRRSCLSYGSLKSKRPISTARAYSSSCIDVDFYNLGVIGNRALKQNARTLRRILIRL